MKEEFLNKIKNKEYISFKLYESFKDNYPSLLSKDFDINKYNNMVINLDYQKYYNYFKNMFKDIDNNIVLDEEQIRAILTDEDYALILAGAGTGKTTTMAAKVKYLVDIKKVDPSKILVMSYTKKATEELEKRILIDFGVPAHISTFHSLGMMYIREIFYNKKCLIVDYNLRENIFLNYFKEKIFPYPEKIKEIKDLFKLIFNDSPFSYHFLENFSKYKTYEEYFEKYKQDKIREANNKEGGIKRIVDEEIERLINKETIRTIKNEIVKSKGEALIANFLFCNNINYEYEKVYEELLDSNRPYRPDFTLELGGQNIYLEYFGLSTYDDDEMNRYNKIRKIKEEYHKAHHTKFIKLDYEKGENLIETLKTNLINLGFQLKPKTYEEIYIQLLDRKPILPVYFYKQFLYDQIDFIKNQTLYRKNYSQIINNYINSLNDNERKEAERQFYYVNDFYLYYQKQLYGSTMYYFDFSDMVYYANLYINHVKSNILDFKYIIIDEYQDISQERYELTKNISIKNNSKVIAVGDDWQTIFSFAGSRIQYIYNFPKYFSNAKILRINHTYRNSQELINYSGKFIMKNNNQIKKNLVSNKKNNNPIKFVLFDDDEIEDDNNFIKNEYKKLKELILEIHKNNPDHNILILARTNRMIKECYKDPSLKDSIGTKIEFVGYEDIDIDGMTIHKSKGLTRDEVIIIGLNKSFPSNRQDTFWLKNIFNYNLNEQIPYPEERRLFYVALTRTKNNVYLLTNKNPNKRSEFVNEIYKIINNE